MIKKETKLKHSKIITGEAEIFKKEIREEISGKNQALKDEIKQAKQDFGLGVKQAETIATGAPLVAVFPTVQSVRLRGRTGRTTAHSPSFWGH